MFYIIYHILHNEQETFISTYTFPMSQTFPKVRLVKSQGFPKLNFLKGQTFQKSLFSIRQNSPKVRSLRKEIVFKK